MSVSLSSSHTWDFSKGVYSFSHLLASVFHFIENSCLWMQYCFSTQGGALRSTMKSSLYGSSNKNETFIYLTHN